MNTILLIFGPSGVGKSTFAENLIKDLNFLHFNFDYWDGKGINGNELQDYISNPQLLRSKIDQRLNGKNGAVLTFPSNSIPTIDYIQKAEHQNIKTLIFYGPRKNCLDAFLERGTPSIENPLNHWRKYNDGLYDGSMIKTEHAPYIIEVFRDNDRKSYELLLQLIRERARF